MGFLLKESHFLFCPALQKSKNLIFEVFFSVKSADPSSHQMYKLNKKNNFRKINKIKNYFHHAKYCSAFTDYELPHHTQNECHEGILLVHHSRYLPQESDIHQYQRKILHISHQN